VLLGVPAGYDAGAGAPAAESARQANRSAAWPRRPSLTPVAGGSTPPR